jgi:phosphatidylglycerol lysyltransferase
MKSAEPAIVASFLGTLQDLFPRGSRFIVAASILIVLYLVVVLAVRHNRRRALQYERFIPGGLAFLTALLGLLNIASAATPRYAKRLAILERLSPLEVRHAGHLIILFVGLLLIYIAGGLARRKNAAWILATCALTISAVAHMAKGLDWEESIASLGLVALFFSTRPSFHAASDRPSLRQGIRMAAAGAVGTLFLGMAGFRAFSARRGIFLPLGASFGATVNALTGAGASPFHPHGTFELFFVDSLTTVAIATEALALFLVLRPVLLKSPSTAEERLRAADIISRYGQSVLDHYSQFEDKHYAFSSGGSVTAFAGIGRRVVALRGPIGPASDASNAAKEFLAICVRNDWEPSIYQASSSSLETCKSAGFGAALCIGHEAIVDLKEFSMAGKKSQDLRTALHRITREGGRVSVFRPPHSHGFVASLRPISNEWIAERHGVEQRFALGCFDEDYLAGCTLAVAFDPQEHPLAFISLLSEYSSGSVAVDLMRSGSHAPKGTMDGVFATALAWAQEAGYTAFNLGLGAFVAVGEHPEDPLLERAIARVIPILERFYSFGGLEAFKNKFAPRWEPRYLVCRSQAALVPSLFAVAQAHLGMPLLPFALASAVRLPRAEKDAKDT